VDLILISSPTGRFQPFEEELLRQYLTTRAGRIILTLDYGHECGLGNLFSDWGVRVDDDVIRDANPEFVADNGDLMIRSPDASHPITKSWSTIICRCASACPARSGPIPTDRRIAPQGLRPGLLLRQFLGRIQFSRATAAVFDAGSDLRGRWE